MTLDAFFDLLRRFESQHLTSLGVHNAAGRPAAFPFGWVWEMPNGAALMCGNPARPIGSARLVNGAVVLDPPLQRPYQDFGASPSLDDLKDWVALAYGASVIAA